MELPKRRNKSELRRKWGRGRKRKEKREKRKGKRRLGCGNFRMEPNDGVNRSKEEEEERGFVYRISAAEEWEAFQRSGSTFGGELDKSTACIHLSSLNQVQSTLQNFFLNSKSDLYLLQIDSKKLGEGLIYEVVDGSNSFPHFYGPSRSFSPLPLDVVTKAERLTLSGGRFSCPNLLD